MENENLAKSHGKVMEFLAFINVHYISFEKNALITYTFRTKRHWQSTYRCKIFYMQKGVK